MKLHFETKPSPISIKGEVNRTVVSVPSSDKIIIDQTPFKASYTIEGTFEGLSLDLELSLEEMPVMAGHLKEMEVQTRMMLESLIPLITKSSIEIMQEVVKTCNAVNKRDDEEKRND